MSDSAIFPSDFNETKRASTSKSEKHFDEQAIFTDSSDVQEQVDSNSFEFWKGIDKDRTLDIYNESLDPVYQAKARILNAAIQEIGMGKYQVDYPAMTDFLVLSIYI